MSPSFFLAPSPIQVMQLLSVELQLLIVAHLSPLDIIRFQRVSYGYEANVDTAHGF